MEEIGLLAWRNEGDILGVAADLDSGSIRFAVLPADTAPASGAQEPGNTPAVCQWVEAGDCRLAAGLAARAGLFPAVSGKNDSQVRLSRGRSD